MNEYITTRPVPFALVAAIENLIPGFCRSVKQENVDGDDVADPFSVRYTAHRSEIGYVRRAIRSAKLVASVAHIR